MPILQLWVALPERKATFLAEDAWITIPYQLSVKTARELLLGLLLQVPGLLERADSIKALSLTEEKTTGEAENKPVYSFEARQCRQHMEFFRDCDRLIQKTDSWMESLEHAESRLLWWYSKTINTAASTSPPPPESRISFAGAKVASLLITYWGGVLELSTAILEIRKLLGTSFHINRVLPLCSNSPCLNMQMDRPTKLALRVCQTAMYLAQGLEGCTVAYGPLLLASKHFRQKFEGKELGCKGSLLKESKERERASVGLACCQQALGMLLKTMYCEKAGS